MYVRAAGYMVSCKCCEVVLLQTVKQYSKWRGWSYSSTHFTLSSDYIHIVMW